MKILLAEDHDHLREILEDYLVENDYEVKSFDNGEDAYYCFLTESFDLVLLDVMMPKMDGFTLVRKLRERGDNTPVLFLTAREGSASFSHQRFITVWQLGDEIMALGLFCRFNHLFMSCFRATELDVVFHCIFKEVYILKNNGKIF